MADLQTFLLEIWSDVSCPWCYIGQKRLDQALETVKERTYPFKLDIVYRPYRINDKLTAEPVKRSKLYAEKFDLTGDHSEGVRRRISQAGETVGIKFSWDLEATLRDTRPCHRMVTKIYNDQGSEPQKRLMARLYQDRNEKDIDVAEPKALAHIVSDLGLMSEDEASSFIDSDELVYEVEKELEKAPNYGIDAVPFYSLDDGRWHFAEAAEVDQWMRVFEQLADTLK